MKGLFLLFLLLMLPGCTLKPYAVRHTEGRSAEKSVVIYVVSHGWHTGIMVPAREIQSNLHQLRERFGKTPYLEFGWGDNLFYPADEMTTGLTLRAILWPTGSVIHAVAVPEKAELFFPDSQVERLCITPNDYSSLISFITKSFYTNEKNDIVQLKDGIYGNSQFYQGEGAFCLLNTCNNWTAKALKSAGMDISPAFKSTADSIMDYIVEYNKALKIISSEETAPASTCRE